MASKEYLERSMVFAAIEGKMESLDAMVNHNYKQAVRDVHGVVCKIPTADVVEVVRCCECVHCDPANKHCDHPMGTTLPASREENDYCSYGEKKRK